MAPEYQDEVCYASLKLRRPNLKTSATMDTITMAANYVCRGACSSQAIAGTVAASTAPTRQMRQAPICTPARNVPRANNVNIIRALASELIICLTSDTKTKYMAAITASQ